MQKTKTTRTLKEGRGNEGQLRESSLDRAELQGTLGKIAFHMTLIWIYFAKLFYLTLGSKKKGGVANTAESFQ